jgi:hypothetical protein
MTVTRMLRPLMRRWIQIRTLLVCAGLVTVAGVALVAQSGLAAIATTEADAREWVKQTVFDGGPTAHILFGEDSVAHALEAFKKLPASARGPATTQLYAWTRAYVSTPAFNAEYVKYRETRKPQPPEYTETAEQELQAKVAKESADQEAAAKNAESMGMKDEAAQMRRQWAAMRDEVIPAWRAEIEEQRKQEKDGFDSGIKQWQERYPPDVPKLLARTLREFLENTSDIDFAAKQHLERGNIDLMAFDNSAYNQKPWQWKLSYFWGPEAIAAARAAAAAWLKDLPA